MSRGGNRRVCKQEKKKRCFSEEEEEEEAQRNNFVPMVLYKPSTTRLACEKVSLTSAETVIGPSDLLHSLMIRVWRPIASATSQLGYLYHSCPFTYQNKGASWSRVSHTNSARHFSWTIRFSRGL